MYDLEVVMIVYGIGSVDEYVDIERGNLLKL